MKEKGGKMRWKEGRWEGRGGKGTTGARAREREKEEETREDGWKESDSLALDDALGSGGESKKG